MRLLVTRPAPDDARTAAALRSQGHAVLTAPMLRMERIDNPVPDRSYAGVVMTSANAVRAISGEARWKALLALPAYTVGLHTAEAARRAGFLNVHCADGDRRDLADMLRSRGDPSSRLLHLAGEDRAGELKLPDSEALVDVAVVYRMAKAERFPAEVEGALMDAQTDGVLHYSRRSAQAYVDCATRAGLLASALAPLHFCLAEQVAEPLVARQQLGASGFVGVKIAAHPDEAALIALVNSCSKDTCPKDRCTNERERGIRAASRSERPARR